MAKKVQTVGCDNCGYYVEFEGYQAAKVFLETKRHESPFGCTCEGIAVVQRVKDLDFR